MRRRVDHTWEHPVGGQAELLYNGESRIMEGYAASRTRLEVTMNLCFLSAITGNGVKIRLSKFRAPPDDMM